MRLQELRYVKDKYGRQYQHEVGNRALQISSDVSNLICTCFAPLQGFTTMYPGVFTEGATAKFIGNSLHSWHT